MRISQSYIRNQEARILKIHKAYSIKTIGSAFSTLSDGDFIKITANSIQQLDQILLDHLFFSLNIEDISSVILYSHMDAFPVVRPAQSKLFLHFFSKQKDKVFICLSGKYRKKYEEVKKMFIYKNTFYAWGVTAPRLPKADMLQICGEFIFIVKLGPKTRENLSIFLNGRHEEFQDLRERHIIKVMRNRNLSIKIREHFRKQVFFPKEMRNFISKKY